MQNIDPLSLWQTTQNDVFILFLCCFFICSLLLKTGRRFIATMWQTIVRQDEHQYLSFQTVNYEIIGKLFLCLQTAFLTSVALYCIFTHDNPLAVASPSAILMMLAQSTACILLFQGYRYLSALIVGHVFFRSENIRIWNTTLLSVLSISGLILFVPALCMFFVPEIYAACLYFHFAYFFCVEIVLAYKVYMIFFQEKSTWYYFILYLCAQNLAPLCLLYRLCLVIFE